MSHVVRSYRPSGLWCHICRGRLRVHDTVRRRAPGRARAYPVHAGCADREGWVP